MKIDLLHLTPYGAVYIALLTNSPHVLLQTPAPDCFNFGELAGSTEDGSVVISGLKMEHMDQITEVLGPLCQVIDGGLGFRATHVLFLDGNAEAVVIDPDTDEAVTIEEMASHWDGTPRWEHLEDQGYVIRGGDGRLADAVAVLEDLRLARGPQ